MSAVVLKILETFLNDWALDPWLPKEAAARARARREAKRLIRVMIRAVESAESSSSSSEEEEEDDNSSA